jgi:beta-galactosidase
VAVDGTRFVVAINHAETDAAIAAVGVDVATGAATDASTLVPAGGTRVIRLAASAE